MTMAVEVRMSMTPKQAGALYMKNVALVGTNKKLREALVEAQKNIQTMDEAGAFAGNALDEKMADGISGNISKILAAT